MAPLRTDVTLQRMSLKTYARNAVDTGTIGWTARGDNGNQYGNSVAFELKPEDGIDLLPAAVKAIIWQTWEFNWTD